MKKAIIIDTITVLYVSLFLYSGISKLMEYSLFEEQLAISSLFEPIARIVALFLICMEFLVVLLLIIPRWRLRGLYLSLTLMIIFTIYIFAIQTINNHLPCNCGGIIENLSWKQHIVFNSAFIVLALCGIVQLRRQKKQIQKEHLNIDQFQISHLH